MFVTLLWLDRNERDFGWISVGRALAHTIVRAKAVRNGSWSNESSVDLTFLRYSRVPFSLELVRLDALV